MRNDPLRFAWHSVDAMREYLEFGRTVGLRPVAAGWEGDVFVIHLSEDQR